MVSHYLHNRDQCFLFFLSCLTLFTCINYGSYFGVLFYSTVLFAILIFIIHSPQWSLFLDLLDYDVSWFVFTLIVMWAHDLWIHDDLILAVFYTTVCLLLIVFYDYAYCHIRHLAFLFWHDALELTFFVINGSLFEFMCVRHLS